MAFLPDPSDETRLDRIALLKRLRQLLPATESGDGGSGGTVPFGIAAIDRHLPGGGLALAALHEVVPHGYAHIPATLGFMIALAARLSHERAGPVFLVCARNGLSDAGLPYGPGLISLGFDPARLILVDADTHDDALWAMEEILRARAALSVLGCLAEGLSLKASRRLHLAAAGAECLLMVLRPHDADGANAAATRWRVGAATAARDRFGLLERWRWNVGLTRARNGRSGEWMMEFDHVAYRFGLARELADQQAFAGAAHGPPGARRSAG